MSGLHISCGTFSGNDKSGSAFEAVLDALADVGGDLKNQIKSGFEENEHVLLSESQASVLLPLLLSYRKELISEIGHDDWLKEVEAEEAAGMDSIAAKWGVSRGWRLYCLTDLIRGCEISLIERQPVLIALC